MEPDPEVLPPPAPVLLPASLVGHWRIQWMELWSQDDVETLGPAFIRLNKDGTGEFSFLCVQGWLDCEPTQREARPALDYSWEGADEGDPRCGRGWLRLTDADEAIVGRFFFHRGDNSAFKAHRVAANTIVKRERSRTRRGAG